MSTFGERLAHAMKLAGMLRASHLAEATACEKATVGQILSGKTEDPRSSNAARFARVLQVDPFWLSLGDGEARPPFMAERAALSAQAVYIGGLLDKIADPTQKAKAYALIVQMLEFGDVS